MQESSSIVTRITCYLQQLHTHTKSINPSHGLINSHEFNFHFTYEYEAYEFNFYYAYLNGLKIKYLYTLEKVFYKKLNICVLILSDKCIGLVLSKVIANVDFNLTS